MLLINYRFKKIAQRLDRLWQPYYQWETQLASDHSLKQNIEALRATWRTAEQLHRQYLTCTESLSGRLLSWLPGSHAFNTRRQLSTALEQTETLRHTCSQATRIGLKKLAASKVEATPMPKPPVVKKESFLFKPLFAKAKCEPEKYIAFNGRPTASSAPNANAVSASTQQSKSSIKLTL